MDQPNKYDENVNHYSGLLKQFQAECLPQEIFTDVLQVFFDSSKCTSETSNQNLKSVDSFLSERTIVEQSQSSSQTEPKKLNKFPKDIQSRSIVNITSDIPEDFSSVTEYFDEYFRHGCGCSKQCHRKFPKSIAFKAHLDALALDHYCPSHVNHQHLLLLGAMNGLVKNHKNPSRSGRKRKLSDETVRTKARTSFKFRGQDVCRKFFTYVFGCGDKRFKNVMKHFTFNGIDSTKHESVYNYSLNKINSNRRRHDALVFIQNFAQQNALQLPGRYGHESNLMWKDLYLLPNNANLSRRHIYDQYSSACTDIKTEPISFALWNELWDLYFPNIQTLNDRREPCFECRQHQQSLVQSDSESSKLESLQRYLNHLNFVKIELDHFRSIVTKCFEIYEDYSKIQNNFEQNLKESFSSTLKSMHYTLNWFSTISLPYDAQNPKIYFKNGYKVALFGIAVEPYQKFILYIIPEFICHQTSQLMNVIISLLHHFFSTYSFGEQESFLHLANGQLDQLKNAQLFSYLIWRTISGKHDKFHVSCLPPGHSHCWNDLFLGVFKKKFRNCQVNSLAEIKLLAQRCCWLMNEEYGNENLIQDPSKLGPRGGHIQTYLVGDDREQILIPLYDWTSKTIMIQKLNSNLLNEYNHFEIGIELPGYILCRKTSEQSETSVSYRLLWNENLSLIAENLPESLELEPLSVDRKSYLYYAVGPFLSSKDSTMKVFLEAKMMYHDDYISNQKPFDLNHRNPNKKSKCSYCKKLGHRETIFGKIRCPKKKKDMKILENSENKLQEEPLSDGTIENLQQPSKISEEVGIGGLNEDQTEELLAILKMDDPMKDMEDQD